MTIVDTSMPETATSATDSVIVYTKPACAQCDATKRALDRAGVFYQAIDVTSTPEAADMLRDLGYAALPVVMVGEQHWSGFRIDRLRALSAHLETAAAA